MNPSKRFFFIVGMSFVLGACKAEDASTISYGEICKKGSEVSDKQPVKVTQFEVTPSSLREQLLAQNTSVLLGINSVHQAKDQVNLSRSNLLPSLNLGVLLGASGGGATFAASLVEVMFPFLVPSNWSRVKESKELYRAQVSGLRSIQANVIASAYSVYQTLLADQEARRIFALEVEDLQRLENFVQKQYQAGLATQIEKDRIHGQLALAQVGMSKMDGLIAQELSLMRHMLALPTEVKLQIKAIPVSQSPYEKSSVAQVLEKATLLSPEKKQLTHLQEAARHESWARRFAFIGGVSMRSPSGRSQDLSVAFDNTSTGAQFNIGYAQVPMVELSQDNLRELMLRERELQLELADRSEYSLGLVSEATQRYDLALGAESSFRSAYEANLLRYRYGLVDLFMVLDARSQHLNAMVERIRAETQLGLNRIVLHRLLMTDQFAQIPECL